MAVLFPTLTVFFFLLNLSTSNARLPTISPEHDIIDRSKTSNTDPGSAVNINIDGIHKNQKESSGKFSADLTEMPASGSFSAKRIPMMVTWRPINLHLNRMRVIRRSLPVHCSHRISRLDGGAQIRQRKSPISEEEKDVIGSDQRHRRYGKIISASWMDGTTFHRLEALTIPDFDGEGLMIDEFGSPRLIFRRHRHHQNDNNGIGHFLWKKIRKFLINL